MILPFWLFPLIQLLPLRHVSSLAFQFNNIYPNFTEWSTLSYTFPIVNGISSFISSGDSLLSSSSPYPSPDGIAFFGGDTTPNKYFVLSYVSGDPYSTSSLSTLINAPSSSFGSSSQSYATLSDITYASDYSASTYLYMIDAGTHTVSSVDGKINLRDECS